MEQNRWVVLCNGPVQKWWQTLLGREILCHEWEDQSMLCRCFFSFKVWWGEGHFFIFLWFPMCSHHVPFEFNNGFPSVSQYIPQYVFHSTSLLSHMLWQMLFSFHLYRWAKGEELYTSKYNLLFWGASIVSNLLSDGTIKLARCKNEKIELEKKLI